MLVFFDLFFTEHILSIKTFRLLFISLSLLVDMTCGVSSHTEIELENQNLTKNQLLCVIIIEKTAIITLVIINMNRISLNRFFNWIKDRNQT